jgi:hypothetical protein
LSSTLGGATSGTKVRVGAGLRQRCADGVGAVLHRVPDPLEHGAEKAEHPPVLPEHGSGEALYALAPFALGERREELFTDPPGLALVLDDDGESAVSPPSCRAYMACPTISPPATATRDFPYVLPGFANMATAHSGALGSGAWKRK